MNRKPILSGTAKHARFAASAILPTMLLALHGATHAQLAECKVTEQSPYVVFLSEPTFSTDAFPKREQMLVEFDRLYLHLDQRRDAEMAGLASIPFKVARCIKRVPAIDGSDFNPEMVRSLYARSVVIEVWGRWDRPPRPGGAAIPTAQMNYLLMPVSRADTERGLQVPALHQFDYPDGDIHASDFVNLISNRDLHAFVVTAIGIMAFDGDEFAKAHQYLCAAEGRLRAVTTRLAKSPQLQAQAAKVELLRAHVFALAAKSLAELNQRAPAAANAAVGLQSAAQPCGGPAKSP